MYQKSRLPINPNAIFDVLEARLERVALRCSTAQPGNLVGEPPVSTSASAFEVEFGREADGVFYLGDSNAWRMHIGHRDAISMNAS
jgi:hypothetical protein